MQTKSYQAELHINVNQTLLGKASTSLLTRPYWKRFPHQRDRALSDRAFISMLIKSHWAEFS